MCLPPNTATLQPDAGINEAVLAAVWNEQSPLRGPMWDCAGNPVAVVYRGRWTAGSGPDFEGAMLSLGGRLVNGSVEMHLRCADWFAHGHHTDPHYNNVQLHVVLWPQAARPVLRADGTTVPTLVLADYITMQPAELLQHVRPTLANLGTLSEEPCWQRTTDWPLERLLAPIDAAGDARLQAKVAVMEADVEAYGSLDEVFYRGIMDSLGYSANREPMRAIADALPLHQLLALPLRGPESERASLLESVLLGAGGFHPSQRPDLGPLDYMSAEYAAEMEAMWRAYGPLAGLSHEPAAADWITNRIRPANSAPRRLAAAARLLARLLWTPRDGMLGPFLDLPPGAKPAQLAKHWTALLQVPADGYWATHSDYGRSLTGKASAEAALVGASRAADIAVNVLLPLLMVHAEREGLPTLRDAVEAAYTAHPKLSENSITEAMSEEALGPRKGAINSARRQQGLIYLYRLYCQSRRCYECPLSGIARA